MENSLIISNAQHSPTPSDSTIPALFIDAGENAAYRFVEFFTANIHNPNTRSAYFHAVNQFCDWCQFHGVSLVNVNPVLVAKYVQELGEACSAPTVKQHLAAIRMLFDYLVTGQVIPMNPAAAVKGPKHVVKKGKTPVLSADEARVLLDSIDTNKISGLRDRALIGLMVYSFARVGAVVGMNVEDYFFKGKRGWIRLHEKGGKYHEVPAHHNAQDYLETYVEAAELEKQKKSPLFRSLNAKRQLTDRRLDRREVLAMIKRRAKKAKLPGNITCHTFRATGITAYLENGGTLETAAEIAAHSSTRTTQLYDRTNDEISLDEIERILI